jgi:putative PEP-CTERM system TPR-repeat lipoprotein
MFRHSRSRTCGRGLGLLLILAALGCQTDPNVAKQEYLKSGDRYVEEQKYSEAIVQYRNALQQDPKFGEARYKLAETYAKVGDVNSAFREYVRAADLLPNDIDLQVKTATLLLLTRQFEDAKKRAEMALDKDPRNIQAQIIRGNALGGLNEFDAAIKQLEDANKLAPSAAAYAAIGAFKGASGEQTDAEKAFRAAVRVDPKNVRCHLALANYLLSVNRGAEAETSLKQALSIDPDNEVANRGLIALYVAAHRARETEPYLKKLAEKDTSPQATYKIALAEFFAQTNRPGDALKILTPLSAGKGSFAPSQTRVAGIQYAKEPSLAHQTLEGVLRREPKNEEALLMKTRFLLSEGKLDDALKTAQAAAAAHPQSAEAFFLVGVTQRARRQPTEAIAAFNEVIKLNPRAVVAQLQLSEMNLAVGKGAAGLQLAEDVAMSAPDAAVVQLNLARNLIAGNQIARAEPIVRQLVARYPKAAPAHAVAGTLAMSKKDLAGARKSYEQALSIDPVNSEALIGLTTVDVSQKNFPAARARIDAALAKAPTNPDILILAGRTYASVGDPAAAEGAFKKAIELAPQSLQAYGLLGKLYLGQRRMDQALAEFEKASQKDPTSVGAPTMAGMILEVQGKRDEAKRRYERALQINPNAAVAANNLAYIYAEQGGNLDVALQLAQTAKQGLPHLAGVNDTLGFVYLKKDLASLAIPPLEASVKKDPQNWIYQYHLGLAYSKAGEKVKARQALERALALNASFPGAEEARKALAGL